MRYQGKHSVKVKRHGKSFRAQLAKEFGVEKTPDSFRLAMEKTYKELPMDMPVAYRPVRAFLRRTATVAAACGLIFLALLGVNTTYPQLTEALPGLGMVFQAINSGNRKIPPNQELPDDRSHLMLEDEPSPTPTPAPSFQPVTISSVQDPFDSLIIEDAWSDGVWFWIEMSLDIRDAGLRKMLSETAYDEASGTQKPVYYLWPGQPSTYTTEDGLELGEVVPDGELFWGGIGTNLPVSPGFAWDEEKQRFSSAFFIPVPSAENEGDRAGPGDTPQGASKLVHLLIPTLTVVTFSEANGGGLEIVDSFSPGYGTKFLVETENKDNREMEPMAEDNGVVLQRIVYTPSEITVEAELPDIGFGKDILASLPNLMEWDAGYPLGIYADLARKTPGASTPGGSTPESEPSEAGLSGASQQSGGTGTGDSAYYHMELVSVNGTNAYDGYGVENWGERNILRYSFKAPEKPKDRDLPLVLTFYETPDGSVWEESGYALDYNPRVLAEFTIEPSQMVVYTSDNYKAEHREKVDGSRKDGRFGSFENGFFCSGISKSILDGGLNETVWLVTQEDMTPRSFSIVGYRNEEPTAAFQWWAGDEPVNDESGEYILTKYTLPSTGQTVFISQVSLAYPDYAADYDVSDGSSWFSRLELIDADTEEVLIADLRENAAQSRLEALGSWVDYEENTAAPSPAPTVQPFGPAVQVPWEESPELSQPEAEQSIG